VPSTEIKIRVSELPKFKELYGSVHAMLLARLLHGEGTPEFLIAINRVIDAHDAIAVAFEDDE
jgi:hypothetical protein